MDRSERALWEIKNEKNKAGVRWLIIFLIVPYLAFLLETGRAVEIGQAHIFNWYYVGLVASFVILVNLIVSFVIKRASAKSYISPSIKYYTMIADFLAVALVMIPTGGHQSMFFTVNYIVIVSNSLRYGLRIALLGTIVMNLFYVAILAFEYYPNGEVQGLQSEILKIGGFWLVGIYTGYLAMRFETLRGEIENYQKLLAEALKNR
ncbi:hypothetical protein LPTSP4_32430 [Leptospira ryugenii]|uniref:Uncharacterized protein n=1 Tax=Leptospira ryugenii TaxID=1917863 RepID=A0A2P2E498_9LEPT|nr:hypothetical protein [Leptospira ryugenii]GBF51705.1 hypothetical protein LPTSP4_32430 [Leptospira ryugenii]